MSLNNQTNESGFTENSTGGPHRLDPATRALVGVILLGGGLGILNSTMVAVGIERLAGEFGASLGTIGWVSTGFLLAVTVTIPVTGWAAERYGGKRMWLAGLGLFVLSSLACGMSWDAGSLIVFRVLQGVGVGILDPLVLILLARAAGPRHAGRVMGLMAAVLSLGPVLGPAVGGAVLQGLGWRWMFLLSVPVGVLAIVLARAVMTADPAPTTHRPPRIDVIGVALLGPGFAGLLLTLTQASRGMGFATWPVLVPLVAGTVLLTCYAWHALRHERPLVDLRLFTRGGLTVSVTVMALTGLALYVSLVVLPLYLQQSRGHGALATGLLVAPLGVGSVVAAPLAGRISDRIGSRALALGGGFTAALAAFAFTWIGDRTSEVWIVLIGLLLGAGLGFVGPPAMGSLYRALPEPLVPQGSSVVYMLNQLGGSVGVAMVAFVMDTADSPLAGFHSVYWLLTGAVVAMTVASTWLPAKA